MTVKEAESVKDLAKGTVEAIKVIMGTVKRECPKCKGSGRNDRYYTDQSGSPNGLRCRNCNGTGTDKISQRWKWEPKVGEWCIVSGKVHLITYVAGNYFEYAIGNNYGICARKDWKNVIPILHWEEIERVLEAIEYYMIVSHQLECPTGVKHGYYCTLWHKSWSDDKEIDYIGKSRQEAVMRSVIALAKELTRT